MCSERGRERERAPVNRAFNCWHLVAGCLIGWFSVGIKIFCRKKDGDSNKEQAMPEGGGSVVSCCCCSDESVKHTCHSLCYNLRFCEEGKRMLLQPSKINPLRKLQVHLPETNLSSQKRFMISWVLLLAWIKVLCIKKKVYCIYICDLIIKKVRFSGILTAFFLWEQQQREQVERDEECGRWLRHSKS